MSTLRDAKLSGMQKFQGLQQRSAWIYGTDSDIRINYVDCWSPQGTAHKGVILLIHGFPQTSYQFRHVIQPLAEAGYRIIAPDYRGAGQSSHPAYDFTKKSMAYDLVVLIHDYLDISEPIHIVGHDIGGMIAHAYASRHEDQVASVVWGECPLPGTAAYEQNKHMTKQFHFMFQSVPDLPEALVTGREKIYLKHFYDKLAYNTGAITPADLEHYTLMYSQPGALRCAFGVYAAFETDADQNREWLREKGKCPVPALALSGNRSGHETEAEAMVNAMYENVEVAVVKDSGHYIAEENPQDFVQKVLAFVGKHSSN